MKKERFVVSLFIASLTVACTLFDAGQGWGQKGAAPANPQAPAISPLAPNGIQRGVPADFIVTGTNLANPTGISLGIPAKITIPTAGKNGQNNTTFKLRIEVSANAPIGSYPLRVATTKGVSNLRVLCVDDLATMAATGANRTKATAQAIPVPTVVSGSILNEQGDYYKISAKAGQRLSFDCLARRIGSAIDVQLMIFDAKSMREIAFENDSPGCQTDARISHTFKEAGDYLIEVKDVLNRGGPEFFYRLRIGDFPLATAAVPMGAKRGTKAKIGFAGPAVEGVAPVEVAVPTDPAVNVLWVAPKSASGLHGWPVPVAVSDHDEAVEQEPNNDPKKANRISVPGGITGRFQQSDDVDCYVFSAKKGQKLDIEAQTLELYSPSLVYMIVKNAKTGAEVAKSNPQLAPPGDQRISFTGAADEDYVLEVQHLHFAGGPSESYRVTIRPPIATYDLDLPNERFEIAPGGAAAIPVQVVRKGYTGPIELSVAGHPGLTGTTTIQAGKKAAILMVAAKPDVPMGAYQFHILGKATIDGKTIVDAATAKAAVVQAMNGLPYPPMHLQTFVALAVKEKAPFSLALKMDPPEGVPGGAATKVTVVAAREPGFTEEITLTPPTGLPATIPAPKIGPIPKGKNEVSFALNMNAKTPLGEYFLFIAAKAKHQGKDYGDIAPPLLLVLGLPFDLKVEPALVSLKPGEKVKVKIVAARKGGYKGPIALDIRNLPKGVTAPKGTIPADQTTVEIEITAAPAAPPGDIATVDVAGTATALNNLLNASPAFTVRVQKK